MKRRHLLAAIGAAQLAAGVAGQALALRDGRAFDIAVLGWRGRPERMTRDTWLLGTGVSAPVVMLATQAAAIGRLAAGPSRRASQVLATLGALMTTGYLVEREFRDAFRPGGRDAELTPTVAVGFCLAVAMAALGGRGTTSD
ncbi:MAG: hypothetical protein WCB04_13235 [Mycobacteriales bacterium]